MKKNYIAPDSTEIQIRCHNMIATSAEIGNPTDTQYGKIEDDDNDKYFGW
ncbi:MAG: hypothetical protein Q4E99_06445 [Bacillota bacterium]|nr:hypothetical protein [Bacillota bacterium]